MLDKARPLALVTGASSGIGEQFARLLAAGEVLGKHDLVLVARRRERLKALKEELLTDGVEVEVFCTDLGTEEGIEALADRLSSPSERFVDLLINNAGFGVNGKFSDISPADVVGQITVNAMAVARLMHAALVRMRGRRTGAILNVSSMAGFYPAPGSAVYAATKAFVTSLTESVALEARDYGVYVGALAPGFTRTEFQDRAGVPTRNIPSPLWQDARAVARAGLIAIKAGKTLEVPGLHNKVAYFGGQAIPAPLLRAIARTFTERL